MKYSSLMASKKDYEKIIWVVPKHTQKEFLKTKGYYEVGSAQIGCEDLLGGICIGDPNSMYFDTRASDSSKLIALGFGNPKNRKVQGNLIKVIATHSAPCGNKEGTNYFLIPSDNSLDLINQSRFKFKVGDEEYLSFQSDFRYIEKGTLRQKLVGHMEMDLKSVAPLHWLSDQFFSELKELEHISLYSDAGSCLI